MKKASMLFVRNNLKWLMGEKISPYALASETGVPQPTIFRILTGESDDPRTKTLQPLAKYFGVSVADLRDRDLATFQTELIQQEGVKAVAEDMPLLDARQREWLGLLHHLGSDDIAEFSAMIRSRQERNVRLIEELENSMHPRKPKEMSWDSLDENFHGKKQSSQSS
ncbi:helix-turn-helix transcriptional regulator [Janthinobacterium sp. MP5059B]|uniref:helix-turn-helix domain-containing protein n=1 Tax=Janthinobacterium sp. MP5059B TaxID=1766683 RepID=UPI0008744AF6|nr:helix-turn-helix transcriptional regulator [Janthinobacterium sp. MP5059B]